MSKPCLWKKEEDPQAANATLWTLREVLTIGLKLLHPYMPFITEEIFCTLWEDRTSFMLEQWPTGQADYQFTKEEEWLEIVKEAVRQIRNTRTAMEVPPSRKAKLFIITETDADREAYEQLTGAYRDWETA